MAPYIKQNSSQKSFHRDNLFGCGSVGVVGTDTSPSTLIPVCNPAQVHKSHRNISPWLKTKKQINKGVVFCGYFAPSNNKTTSIYFTLYILVVSNKSFS